MKTPQPLNETNDSVCLGRCMTLDRYLDLVQFVGLLLFAFRRMIRLSPRVGRDSAISRSSTYHHDQLNRFNRRICDLCSCGTRWICGICARRGDCGRAGTLLRFKEERVEGIRVEQVSVLPLGLSRFQSMSPWGYS
jgi:hypothetical protein